MNGMGDVRRVALITGGTGALGTAVTRAFLAQGSAVVATYRAEPEAERVRTALGGAGRLDLQRVDVTSTAEVATLVEQTLARHSQIDYLINLVGAWAGGLPVWETGDAEWERMLAVNLRSTFVCCRAVLPHLLERGFGRIVNVASRTALQPSPGAAAYAVSKMGVITLTETLALELRQRDADVTANCVVPSVIDTEANRRAMPGARFEHWVRPEQLAAIILWLTSADAAPINGAAIPVYGRA